jgi:hypothetical protein
MNLQWRKSVLAVMLRLPAMLSVQPIQNRQPLRLIAACSVHAKAVFDVELGECLYRKFFEQLIEAEAELRRKSFEVVG